MAAIEEVALFNELGTDQDAVKGLALARMVKDVPQVLRTIPQLILHQYLIQNDRTKRCFREQLVNLLKPRCLDVDLQEEIFGILQEIKEQDGE
jgi:hypothetical protein